MAELAHRATLTTTERLQLEGLVTIARQGAQQEVHASRAILDLLGLKADTNYISDAAMTLPEIVRPPVLGQLYPRPVDWFLEQLDITVEPDPIAQHSSTDDREALLFVRQKLQDIRAVTHTVGTNSIADAHRLAGDALEMATRAID